MEKKSLETGILHKDLIESCRRKDRQAQFQLYRLYVKSMYNTAHRIVNHSAEAEDAVQEAFLAAFSALSDFNGQVSFGSWLKRITIRKAIDILRKKKQFQLTEEADIFETSDYSEFPAEVAEEKQKELIEAIHEAMYRLPDGYRVVFSLYMLEGYDHEEIGTILGIKESASRSQLARARKAIAGALRENGMYQTYHQMYG